MKWRMSAALAALVLVGIVVALVLSAPRPQAAGAESTVLFARSGDSYGLDPQGTEWGEDAMVLDSLFETLVRFQEGSVELEPGLAESWQERNGGIEWEFALRKNVFFHDGTLFSADAVVFTFERLIRKQPDNPYAPESAPYASMYEVIEKIEAIDQYKVRFTLKTPSAVFLKNLAMFPAGIVSPEAAKKEADGFARNPVGTGPMQFVQWQKDVKLEIARNPRYWNPEKGARCSGVIFLPRADARVRVEDLRTGHAHIVNNIGLADLKALQKDERIRLDFAPAMNVCYLGFNMNQPPYSDPKFRQAVAHAVNFDKLIEKGYHGLAERAGSLVPPAIFTGDGTAKRYPYDPERARELLKEVQLPEDGVTIWHPNFSRPYVPEPDKVAEAIKDDLIEVGLKVKVESMPIATFREKTKEKDHPMFILGWSTDNADPDNFFFALLHGSSIGGTNATFMDDPRFNELVKKGQEEVEPSKRRALYVEAEKVFQEALPLLPLVHVRQAVAFSKDVKYRLHPIETRAYLIEFAPAK